MRILRQSQRTTISNINESDIIRAISCNITQNLEQVSVLNSIHLMPCFHEKILLATVITEALYTKLIKY